MITSGNIPFHLTDWAAMQAETNLGETGSATSRTLTFGSLRVRLIEYSANYKADHWCQKGHIIYCIEGEMDTELADGSIHTLKKGMSYQVSNDLSSHRTTSRNGVKLFVVDGDFLSAEN
jgi:hypothetical protein